MTITITSLKLKHLWGYFPLTYRALWVTIQVHKQKGMLKFKNTGFGYDHYTLTAWESEENMKAFSRSGAHLEAMKHSKRLATEIRVLTYKADEIPTWKDVRLLLENKAQKILKFD